MTKKPRKKPKKKVKKKVVKKSALPVVKKALSKKLEGNVALLGGTRQVDLLLIHAYKELEKTFQIELRSIPDEFTPISQDKYVSIQVCLKQKLVLLLMLQERLHIYGSSSSVYKAIDKVKLTFAESKKTLERIKNTEWRRDLSTLLITEWEMLHTLRKKKCLSLPKPDKPVVPLFALNGKEYSIGGSRKWVDSKYDGK